MTVDVDSEDEANPNAGEDADNLPLDPEGVALQRTLIQVTYPRPLHPECQTLDLNPKPYTLIPVPYNLSPNP
jgi:hypothetical protein